MPTITRVTKAGVQSVHHVENPSISFDGRYILGSSAVGFNSIDRTFRYDSQTGDMIQGFPTLPVFPPNNQKYLGTDLSGDGRYWTLVDTVGIAAALFPHSVADFSLQAILKTYPAGMRQADYNVYSISEDGTAVSIRFNQSVPSFVGPGEVRIGYWQTNAELRVPMMSSTSTLLTDDSLSRGGERVVFSVSGSVYYADAAGGAPGFTQAPVLIAAGANASISGNGRYVVFESSAALLAGDTNPEVDIYLKDLQTGTLTLVSTAADGTVSNRFSTDASLSGNGRYVVFESDATNLVANDTNAARDIFLKDLVTGEMTRVSVSNDGTQANANSRAAEISGDGSTITFLSFATNLVPGDTNGFFDIFRVALGDDVISPASAPGDFNVDGISDVLLRQVNGFTAEWQMNTGQIANNLGIGMPSPDYQFQDTGDFNADGASDILWRHAGGQVVMWEMDGNQILINQAVAALSNSWHNEGVGDLNGDGRSDILWRHDSGQVVVWQMNGANIVSNQSIATPGNDWHVQGLVDTDADGKADVLLRHNSGQVVLWTMDGAQIVSNQSIATPGLDWNVAGTGDFNGDGRGDILWRNDSGQVVVWEMAGANIISNQSIATPSNNWRIQDVGDYNADGFSDVLWRDDSGHVAMWVMDGAQIASNHAVTAGGQPVSLAPDWTILNHHYDLL